MGYRVAPRRLRDTRRRTTPEIFELGSDYIPAAENPWERRHPCLLALEPCRQGCLRSQGLSNLVRITSQQLKGKTGDLLFRLARQHRVENLGLPFRDRISHQRAQLRPAQPGQRFYYLFVLGGADQVRLARAAVLHQKEGEQRRHDSLQTIDQILVARNLPEFAMEGQVVLIKLIEVELLRRRLHLHRDAAQVFDVFGRHVLFCPLDGQRFQLRAQAEDLLHLAPFQFGDRRALVGDFLHVPLMFQLDQRLAYQRDAGAQLLGDLALDDRLARLNDPAQNRLLERGHNLISLRDRLDQP